MAMSTTSPVPLNNVRLISSGSGSVTGNGAVQDITNFTCPVLGNLKRLYITLRMRKTLGALEMSVYFSPTAGAAFGTGTINARTSAADSISIVNATICKDIQESTKADVLVVGYEGGATELRNEIMTFNVEAGCTFYLCASGAAAGNNLSYSYQAYLVG